MVGAGLERDVERGAPGGLAGGGQRGDLGVGPPGRCRGPLEGRPVGVRAGGPAARSRSPPRGWGPWSSGPLRPAPSPGACAPHRPWVTSSCRGGSPASSCAIIEHVSVFVESAWSGGCEPSRLERPRTSSRPVTSAMIAVCGAAESVASSWAPLRTPIDRPGTGRVRRPRGRSPCRPPRPPTAGSSTPRRAMAPRIRSGAGRPRPTSAGERARSISSRQPRASSSASRVEGANPVVRQTLTPRPSAGRAGPGGRRGSRPTSPAATIAS